MPPPMRERQSRSPARATEAERHRGPAHRMQAPRPTRRRAVASARAATRTTRSQAVRPVSNGRRTALAAFGAAGATLLAGRPFAQTPPATPAPACVLTPAQTEGPYFVDERLNRTDVRIDPADRSMRPGALLTLQLRVASVDAGRCAP